MATAYPTTTGHLDLVNKLNANPPATLTAAQVAAGVTNVVGVGSDGTLKKADGTTLPTGSTISSTDALPEGTTNKYYTDARAKAAVPASNITTTQVTDVLANLGIGNRDGGNVTFLQTLVARALGGEQVLIPFRGDSTTSGGAQVRSNTVVYRLAQELSLLGIPSDAEARFGDQLIVAQAGHNGGSFASYSTFDPAVTFTGGFGIANTTLNLGSYCFETTAAGTIVFNCPVQCEGFDIVYRGDSSALTATTTLSGGSAVASTFQIDQSGGQVSTTTPITSDTTIHCASIRGLTKGIYTLTISAAATAARVIGFMPRFTTFGSVSFLQMGAYGQTLGFILSNMTSVQQMMTLKRMNAAAVITRGSHNDSSTIQSTLNNSLQGIDNNIRSSGIPHIWATPIPTTNLLDPSGMGYYTPAAPAVGGAVVVSSLKAQAATWNTPIIDCEAAFTNGLNYLAAGFTFDNTHQNKQGHAHDGKSIALAISKWGNEKLGAPYAAPRTGLTTGQTALRVASSSSTSDYTEIANSDGTYSYMSLVNDPAGTAGKGIAFNYKIPAGSAGYFEQTIVIQDNLNQAAGYGNFFMLGNQNATNWAWTDNTKNLGSIMFGVGGIVQRFAANSASIGITPPFQTSINMRVRQGRDASGFLYAAASFDGGLTWLDIYRNTTATTGDLFAGFQFTRLNAIMGYVIGFGGVTA